ncbi:MAG TPA: MoxR family ATPase [Actinomycetaceae bacterium]|nr:MoxR family ATPase [Actinomycetaceae bacterium]
MTTMRQRIGERVVGRQRELDLILAVLEAGRDILVEGPPGTSKSTLLRAIAAEWGVPVVLVEGNADLTPAKLIGSHDPARVLQEGYRDDNFVDGPLLRAMREGGFLYIEEFNRAPDDTINTLLSAITEREIVVPRIGRVAAAPTFRVIGTMNPHDNVGTTALAMSVHDRFNRLEVGYQDAEAELAIVAMHANGTHASGTQGDGVSHDGTAGAPARLAESLRHDAVQLTRATREHPEIRQGSSVRGAIDLYLVTMELLQLRGITEAGEGRAAPEGSPRHRYATAVYDAMVVALSGRIHVDEASESTPEAVLRHIWETHFLLDPAAAEPG